MATTDKIDRVSKYTQLAIEDAICLAKTTTNCEVLAELSKDERPDIRREVALNRFTSPTTLEELVQDESLWSRIASNPNCPPDQLVKFLKSKKLSFVIREAALSNPSTPTHILIEYCESTNEEVLRAIAANPKTPVEALRKICQNTKLPYIMKLARAHVNYTEVDQGAHTTDHDVEKRTIRARFLHHKKQEEEQDLCEHI